MVIAPNLINNSQLLRIEQQLFRIYLSTIPDNKKIWCKLGTTCLGLGALCLKFGVMSKTDNYNYNFIKVVI